MLYRKPLNIISQNWRLIPSKKQKLEKKKILLFRVYMYHVFPLVFFVWKKHIYASFTLRILVFKKNQIIWTKTFK